MDVINIINNDRFLNEYIELCALEWGSVKSTDLTQDFIESKKKKIHEGDKVISVLGLVDNDTMIGFISLFKYDGDERRDLTPWYATMYVKNEYRGKGYSIVLNDAILKEASKLG